MMDTQQSPAPPASDKGYSQMLDKLSNGKFGYPLSLGQKQDQDYLKIQMVSMNQEE